MCALCCTENEGVGKVDTSQGHYRTIEDADNRTECGWALTSYSCTADIVDEFFFGNVIIRY